MARHWRFRGRLVFFIQPPTGKSGGKREQPVAKHDADCQSDQDQEAGDHAGTCFVLWDHRFAAAALAISDRRSGGSAADRFAAAALPSSDRCAGVSAAKPFGVRTLPPLRPITAAASKTVTTTIQRLLLRLCVDFRAWKRLCLLRQDMDFESESRF